MSRVFADTSFFVAFLSERDEHHAVAIHFMADPKARILTTGWVLAELGNFLARGIHRTVFVALTE
ncbi:MAG: PIN domain-containing protein [Pirellulales bacterium]|nr:PIN domain-containing protein [Pirellulales bacterium]